MSNALSENLVQCTTSLTSRIDGKFRLLCENSETFDRNYSATTIRNNRILHHNIAHL